MIVSFSVKQRDVDGHRVISEAKEFVVMNALPSFSSLVILALSKYLEEYGYGTKRSREED